MKRVLLLAFLSLATSIAVSSPASAQTTLARRTILKNLRIPTVMVWGPDNWLWVGEIDGRIFRVDPSTLEVREIFQVPDVYTTNEAGLLGMALHPDSSYVYLSYNYWEENEIRIKMVRYRYNGDTFVEPLKIIQRVSGNTLTNGGRMCITTDKKLLLTIGDGGQPSFAQSGWFLNGKVLRMNLDGSVPSDNPWRTAPSPLNLIWTSGHRDGRGLATTPSGVVFLAEQGGDSVDELNVIYRRRNYGWPRVVGYCDAAAETKFCSDSSVVAPARIWRLSVWPGSMTYYDSPAIPEWRGCLLMTTLDDADIRVMRVSGASIASENIYASNEFGRLRAICWAPDGRVFVATSNRDEKGIPTAGPDDDRIIELGGNVALASLGTPVITGDTAGIFHAGDSVHVSFTANNFSANNTFTAEISDANGNFARPSLIGRVSATGTSVIHGIIPCGTAAGSNYHFRVVANSPGSVRADVTSGYSVIPTPPGYISPAQDMSICPGDSVVLHARVGGNNLWSTGQNGDQIVARTAGQYWVATTVNGCPTYSDTVNISLAPVPAPSIVHIASNVLDAGGGFARYEWYLDDTLLVGMVSRSIIAPRSGRYVVRVRNGSGCWGSSPAYDHTMVSGITGEGGGGRTLRIVPHPVGASLQIEFPVPHSGEIHVRIADVSGAIVERFDTRVGSGTFRTSLDVSRLAPGVYLLDIRDGRDKLTRAFVKE